MTNISKPSRQRSSRHSNSPRMKMVEYSCGLETLPHPLPQPLNLLCQHHSQLCRNSHPLRLNLSLLHLLLTLNADSSRSCSVISWTPLDSPADWTPKSTGTWSVPTKTSARESFNAMK